MEPECRGTKPTMVTLSAKTHHRFLRLQPQLYELTLQVHRSKHRKTSPILRCLERHTNSTSDWMGQLQAKNAQASSPNANATNAPATQANTWNGCSYDLIFWKSKCLFESNTQSQPEMRDASGSNPDLAGTIYSVLALACEGSRHFIPPDLRRARLLRHMHPCSRSPGGLVGIVFLQLRASAQLTGPIDATELSDKLSRLRDAAWVTESCIALASVSPSSKIHSHTIKPAAPRCFRVYEGSTQDEALTTVQRGPATSVTPSFMM